MNNFRINLVIFALIWLMLSGHAFADPYISGVNGIFDNYNNISVSGIDFGTKSQVAPLLWDDFESGGSLGQSVSSSSKVNWNTDGTAPKLSNEKQRGASNRNAKAVVSGSKRDGNTHDLFYKNRLDFSSGKIYINFWFRPLYNVGPDQFKFWRLCSGNGLTNHYPSIALFYTNNWDRYQLTRASSNGSAGSTMNQNYSGSYDGNWHNIILEVEPGSVNKSNGRIENWFDQTLQDADENINILTQSGYNFSTVRFGEYVQNSDKSQTIYYDNIYVDNTWSRAEICDDSDRSRVGHCEIQIPTKWSNSSITLTVNHGSFKTGQTAYLYVVDSNGNANSKGFPITIGGGGAPPTASQPSPPTGLKVLE